MPYASEDDLDDYDLDDYDGPLDIREAIYFAKEDERLFLESGGNPESVEYAVLLAKLSVLEHRYEESINVYD